MKRRTFQSTVIAAALGLAAALPAAAQSPVKVQFWDMIWGPAEYIDVAKGLVAEFNKTHPAIQVEYRSVPWTNWYQTYLTAINAGSAPDLSTGAGYQAVQLYDLDAIRPLDDLIDEMGKSGELKDFREGTVDRLKYKGHYVAVPWALDLRVWYYRKDLLDAAKIAPPKTLADMRSAAKALSKDGRYGLILSGDWAGMQTTLGLALNNGGGLFTPDGKPALKNERNVQAWKVLADMAADGSISPASPGASGDDARRAFLQGKAVFLYDSPGVEADAGADAAKIGVLAPPAGERGDKGTIAWVNNLMVYKQTKNPEAVKTFIKWWTKNQKALFTKGRSRQIPARVSLAEDATVKNRAPSFALATAQYLPVAKGTGTPLPGIFPVLNAVEGDGFLQTLTQRIGQKRPLADAVSEADKAFQELVAK